MLHQLAAGMNGVLVVSVFNANLPDDPGTITHHRVGDVDSMAEAIEAHLETPHANVYAGLQVMRAGLKRGKRGRESDIVAILGLVVDLDADTGKSGALPFEPDMVLETSPGNFQPFTLFDRPLPPSEVKPMAAALKRATDSDHGTADVTHVWRVPGTQNWPNKKKLGRGRSPDPVPVIVAKPWDGSLTNVDELRAALAPWWSAPRDERQVEIGELPDVDGLVVSEKASLMLAANDVGDRSDHAAAVVEQLAFDGHSAEEALALFLAASGDWFGRYRDAAHAHSDFERCWGKFGARHAEDWARAERMNAELLGKKRPTAANDNHPGAEPPRILPVLPRMHSAPFTPEAAGGLLADISRWITDTAIIPVPELSLCSAIALIGGMFGDRALGPTRSGLNMFLTTVMGVASGKGHAPKSIIQLATVAGKPGAVTNGDPTSYAAIERMLRRNSSTVKGDVRALIDHDTGRVIGRTKSRTLRLSTDNHGLRVEIDVPDTADGRDLWTLVERNDISGMSFGFRVTHDEWDETGDLPQRTIHEVELYEVSAVAFPAYDDTSLGVRSLEAARAQARKIEGEQIKKATDAAAAARRVVQKRASMEQRIRGIRQG
jgi:HK97 family phage prohead protease